MTSNIRGSSICSPKSLYKKTSQEILAELKAVVKTCALKVPRPEPSYPSATTCVRRVSTVSSHPHRRHHQEEGRRRTLLKWTFRVATIIAKWIINDCYIFFPYLRVWVFLFLWTSFFKAQHGGPMLQSDIKQSDGEVPVMLELWGMQNTYSLPSLPGPLWPGEVAPDRVLSMGQIGLNCVLVQNWIVWNRLFLTLKLCTYVKQN